MQKPRLLVASLALAGIVCGGSWAYAQKAADLGPAKYANPAQTQSVQDLTPAKQLALYLDGYHNYKDQADLPPERQHQMRVTHYCQQLNGDVIQCVVYDGNTKGAHLIGIEHIISDKLYQGLPAREKAYWHPHDGEVDSGMLLAPGLSAPAHKALMDFARSTHGKTWHVWDTHKDALPYGEPQLMWAIRPDQINAETRKSMEERKKNPTF